VLRLELQDLNGSGKIIKASQPLVIEDLGDAISASDIEVIEYAKKGGDGSPFFKSGY
jgi:hypothetical protein